VRVRCLTCFGQEHKIAHGWDRFVCSLAHAHTHIHTHTHARTHTHTRTHTLQLDASWQVATLCLTRQSSDAAPELFDRSWAPVFMSRLRPFGGGVPCWLSLPVKSFLNGCLSTYWVQAGTFQKACLLRAKYSCLHIKPACSTLAGTKSCLSSRTLAHRLVKSTVCCLAWLTWSIFFSVCAAAGTSAEEELHALNPFSWCVYFWGLDVVTPLKTLSLNLWESLKCWWQNCLDSMVPEYINNSPDWVRFSLACFP